ncbi:glycosyltransferase [Rhizobium sp. BK176]|uniref:glycosyltransferase n=1 Tax=Rhizobium sp. BK176 TaxID=2587071 RepID=UPI002168F623|nr:glycosyltransferase [Rhizobium sp. BK176]MCS4089989.1 glycosyltransferase involved in cell wall biosynthesis [Rhizobium sp. BK176]
MKDKIRIAVVSRGDETCGGASRVAEDLARQMAARGHEATHFVTWTSKGFTDTRKSLYGPGMLRPVTTLAHRAARKFGLAEMVPFELPAAMVGLRGFDVIHFHDTSGSISPLTLSAAARIAPVAWTFHDCSPFTGGCLYPQMAGCQKYKDGCGDCPLSNEWPIYGWSDRTPNALAMRRRLHRKGRVSVITPSQWMADTAWASGNLSEQPTVISNMVDTAVFAEPEDRAGLRARLGLPQDRPVIAISAASIGDERKNVGAAIAGAVAASSVFPTVVLIGKPDPKVHAIMGPIDFMATGYVSDRKHLAEWLSAADAFMATPMADNQPLAIMEALACGTPVYGWPTGGIAEMVVDGVTGRMIRDGSASALGEAISSDWSSKAMSGMRSATRRKAVRNFSPSAFAENHEKHYRAMMGMETGA